MSSPSKTLSRSALVYPETMRGVDQAAIAAGFSLDELVQDAGEAVADAAAKFLSNRSKIAVLAGPGNNGADALIAARRLARSHEVTVFELETKGYGPSVEHGDAIRLSALSNFGSGHFDLVVDGLFGTGLNRPIVEPFASVIEALNASPAHVVSIDIASGVSGADGAVHGIAVRADLTVTFVARKPGHLLMPGRQFCGEVVLADIGMPDAALSGVEIVAHANEAALWGGALVSPSMNGHKYDRGHAVVFSGGASRTGAARLAAISALRAGAGLVTVFSPASAVLVNAMHLTAVMLRRCDNEGELGALLEDKRYNAFVLGPGFGTGGPVKDYAFRILEAQRRLVLDADGLTSFADDPDGLFQTSRRHPHALVLTPHAGEFARLFPDIATRNDLSKLEKAKKAAERAGCVLVYKGADTVIAAPDGKAAINATGTGWLATAGTGDVLSGIVSAQLAQGVPTFEAACIAVWMHGRAAELFGPGLVAEDVAGALPRVHAEMEELLATARARDRNGVR